MKVKLNTYKESPSVISIEWEHNSFEESVVDELFKEGGVFAKRFGNCIHLEAMDKELETIINKYFKRKYLNDDN